MRFLSDQDVWQVTVNFLRALGHEVQRAADVGLERASVEAVHQELGRFLGEHSEEDLRRSFVVIEPGRHRIRRASG